MYLKFAVPAVLVTNDSTGLAVTLTVSVWPATASVALICVGAPRLTVTCSSTVLKPDSSNFTV